MMFTFIRFHYTHTRVYIQRVLLLSAALTLSACLGLGQHFEAPKLTVVHASMISADVFSQHFRVRLHVTNPNAVPLSIKNIEYELFLQGDSFAEGKTDKAFVVPALGETEFELIVHTHFISSVARLLDKISRTGNKQVQYDLEGKVYVRKSGTHKIPFHETGTVDLTTVKP